jgi:hypothetical protein
VIAKAATFLPGEYAAVRNILEELERRFGRGWLDRAQEAVLSRRPEDTISKTPGLDTVEEGVINENEIEHLKKREGGSLGVPGDASLSSEDVAIEEDTITEESDTLSESKPMSSPGKGLSVVEVSDGLGPGLWWVKVCVIY